MICVLSPQRILSGLREIFINRCIGERTIKAEIRPEEQREREREGERERQRRVVGRIYGMKCS